MVKKLFSGLIVVVLIASCHKNYYDQPDYVGTWNNGNVTVIFGSNNTYSITSLNLPVSSGLYSAQNNVLSLTGTSGACHDSLPATYSYTYYVSGINGDFVRHLALAVSADSCTARVAALPGTYSTTE